MNQTIQWKMKKNSQTCNIKDYNTCDKEHLRQNTYGLVIV